MKPAFRHDEVLTEDNIKKETLRFLKAYYRSRQRAGETVVSSDMRGSGGIIADGYLTFPKEDGNRFIATFEATSLRKRNEVRFQTDQRIITWDGIALAFFGTAIWIIYAYLNNLYTVKEVGQAGALFVLAIVGISLFTIFQLLCLFFKPRRYRYIYAVEQFKRYYADEQWIAVGENVFSGKDSRYFRELRHQCTYNGFGLIMVNLLGDQLRPVPLITPSRQQLFGHRRQVVQFFKSEEVIKRIQKSRPHQWWRKRVGYSLSPEKAEAPPINRFRRQFYNQLIIAVSSLAFIVTIFFIQKKETAIYEPDEEDIRRELMRRKENPTYQPQAYKLDTPYFYPPIFDGTVTPYSPDAPTKTTPSQEAVVPPEPEPAPGPDANIIISSDPDTYVFYDCARFYNLGATKYIIVEEVYEDLPLAEVRMNQINDAGVAANVLWLGCFFEWENGYAVYLDIIYNTSEEALLAIPGFERQLAPAEPGGWLEIRSLSPVSR